MSFIVMRERFEGLFFLQGAAFCLLAGPTGSPRWLSSENDQMDGDRWPCADFVWFLVHPALKPNSVTVLDDKRIKVGHNFFSGHPWSDTFQQRWARPHSVLQNHLHIVLVLQALHRWKTYRFPVAAAALRPSGGILHVRWFHALAGSPI